MINLDRRADRRDRPAIHHHLLAGLALSGAMLPGAGLAVEFEMERLFISDYHLDDHGVADVDGDGNLDVFTTNHNAQQSLLLGNGDGDFSAVDFEDLGLVQNPEFPGLPDSRWRPEEVGEGVFIYSRLGRLIVSRVGLPGLGTFRGSLYLRRPPVVTGKGFTHATVCEEEEKAVYPCRFDFEATDDGVLKLNTSLYQNPRLMRLATDVPLDAVRLGMQRVHPTSHEFKLRLMDRHGIAWSDVDGDGSPDAYISSGGVSDQLPADHPEVDYNNELFCQRGAAFSPCIDGTGLIKEADRGRRVAWTDIDGDGRLDLYVDNRETANRLFRRQADGSFVDEAPSLGLDAIDSGPAVWFDVDNDSDPDLLAVEATGIVLYRRSDAGFVREEIGAYLGGLKTWSYGKFSLFDLDGDGHLEALLASPKGSSLVSNDAGLLSARSVRSVGLPSRSYSLDFVDVDADGTVEVHALTWGCEKDGIYVWTGELEFVRTQMLPALRQQYCSTARSLWFDADNNGFPDLLLSRKIRSASNELWKTHVLGNQGSENRWLQIDLAGPPGNREAIGARVRLTIGERSAVQQVGQFEGSRYSQGHYRLYFGLGAADRVERLEVFWPDGGETVLVDLEPNRIMTISRDGASP